MSLGKAEVGRAETAEQDGGFSVNEKIKKPKRKKRKIVIPVVVLLLAGAAVFVIFNRRNSRQTVQAAAAYVNHTVGVRGIMLSLSGTGTLKPANSYTVTTLISGDILSAPFEEGDTVEKDTVLYTVDSADLAAGIEQAELSLAQSQRSYEQKLKSLADLEISAVTDGEVIELLVDTGDKVSAGQTVARLRDSAVMCLTIPFGADDAEGFAVGQTAAVTLDGSFEQLAGTITKINNSVKILEGNMLVREVVIDVNNPGGISDGQLATAFVGDTACNSAGTFTYKSESAVTAAVSGEAAQLHISEGDRVSRGQPLITLVSESLDNEIKSSSDSLRNSEISLENKYDQLNNYTIKSPISGTIIEKNYKAGDTLESGKTLCTIFDLTYLTMTLNIDELDISKVETGQPVTVTAEALSGRVYQGVVTKVNINGTTANGVTSYPVTIRIDDTEGLLPGMNVQATIIVSQKTGVTAIPVSALSRGNRVLVQGAAAPEGETAMPGVPEGFAYVQVTPGISDGEYIEIISGLNEGDVITYMSTAVDFSANMTQFAGFGAPGGGMQGGAVRIETGPGGGGNASYTAPRG